MRLSLETFQNLQDRHYQAVLQLEMGVIYQTLGNYVEAEAVYHQALDYWQETQNSLWQANLLNNLGYLQYLSGDYESAASTLEKALEHAHLSGYLRMEAFALSSIGDLYRDLDAANEALDAYHQARQIAQHIDEKSLLVLLNIAEAILAIQQGKYSRSIELLLAAREQAEATGDD
jgi:LuxR family transcriptional regulator, maltose regulon positive regulatory protein